MAPVIGVDIGGTKIRWVVLRGGRLFAAKEIKTPRRKEEFLAALRTVFAIAHKRGIRRVGIGFPGTLKGTKIKSARNLPFLVGIDLAEIAPRGVRVRVDNDARCYALAEARRGAGRGVRRLLVLAVGTGIGRGYAKNGKVLTLARLSRAEEWERAYQARVALAPPALARFLGEKLAGLIAELGPDAVVIGGGAMRKRNFFTLLRRALRQNGVRIPVRRSRLHQNAGAIGAAILVEK